MKLFLALLFIFSTQAFAQDCDVRLGTTIGLKVMEFHRGHEVLSKMTIKETTAEALHEEFVNLQDEGLCSQTIPAKKCILRFEKRRNTNFISFFRDGERWATWFVKSKNKAQAFVKSMKRAGLCL
jgi:hypothetical protein